MRPKRRLAKQTDGRRLAFRAVLVFGPRYSVSLMAGTGLILEKSVYSHFNQLTRLLAPESFIQFSRSERFRFCLIRLLLFCLRSATEGRCGYWGYGNVLEYTDGYSSYLNEYEVC